MDEIRHIRKERGLSQQRLSELAGVDKVTIVHIENGKVSPKVETLAKLADALGVEVADFFPKAEPPLFPPDMATPEQGRSDIGRSDIDVRALDEKLAADLRQQRQARLQELDAKLARAGGDQDRREEAYRNLKNWWVWFLQPVMSVHEFIPEIPGPALLREGDITVERVREFARRTYANDAERDAELRMLEEAYEQAKERQ
jgi:transcriptional regulator with XRE-family HTH domain